MESIVSENLLANRIRKNNHETLNMVGVAILIIQKVRIGSLEYHNPKLTNIKIKNMIIGTKIVEIKIIKREASTPFISLDIIF
ncbi:MAG: hypothetical protein P8Y70_07830 [Candidatus Lokiarchaeota archaeon]